LEVDFQGYIYPERRIIPISLVYIVLYIKEYRSIDRRDIEINTENQIRNIAKSSISNKNVKYFVHENNPTMKS